MRNKAPMCSYMNNENIQADVQWGCTYREVASVHTLYKQYLHVPTKRRGMVREKERKKERKREGERAWEHVGI